MNGFDFLLKPAAAATVSSPLSSATPFSPSCPRRSDVLARSPLLLVVLSSQGFDVRVCLSVCAPVVFRVPSFPWMASGLFLGPFRLFLPPFCTMQMRGLCDDMTCGYFYIDVTSVLLMVDLRLKLLDFDNAHS